MASINEDLAALDRILLRITGTSNESLLGIVSSLLPKLLPLANREQLRRKVVEIVAEIIRRIKLASLKLPLDTLQPVLSLQETPYPTNIALGIIDSLTSASCVAPVDSQSLASLLQSLKVQPQFSYPSNNLLFYCTLEYSEQLPSVQVLGREISNLLGDYLLDVLLLKDLAFEDGSGSVTAGLSDKRKQRLAAKKTMFVKVPLLQTKLKVMDLLIQTLQFEANELAFLCALVAKCDAETTIATKGIFLLNMINEKLPAFFADIATVSRCLELVFAVFLNANSADRTMFSLEVMITFLKELLRFWERLPEQPVALIAEIYHRIVLEGTKGLNAEGSSRLLSLFCELLQKSSSLLNTALKELIVDTIWHQMKSFSSSSDNGATVFVDVRQRCYQLLKSLVEQSQAIPLLHSAQFLLKLLELVEQDQLSTAGGIFELLEEVRSQKLQLNLCKFLSRRSSFLLCLL
jgi:hypothetical protein